MKRFLLIFTILIFTSFVFAGKIIYIEGVNEFSDANLYVKLETFIKFGDNFYKITITNKSQKEITILWSKSIITDNYHRPVAIVPDMLVNELLEKPQLATVIKPGSTVSFVIFPSSHVLTKKTLYGRKFVFLPLTFTGKPNRKISIAYECDGKLIYISKEYVLKARLILSIKDILFISLLFSIFGGLMILAMN
ncbi:MAG: hypothetical protein H0Z24_06275 [Thermosipho sp. (in: Bacteria)]|nr:hypothetical protein [Thermosipho sp. (in: thermotogales)]